jgi:hypothetical protein
MCDLTWSRGRSKCVYESTRHGGRVGSGGAAAWLGEKDPGSAREDDTKEKWPAMASADVCAFIMKLYRKLRCRACTASLVWKNRGVRALWL